MGLAIGYWRDRVANREVIAFVGQRGRPSSRGMALLAVPLGALATLGAIVTGPIAGLALIGGTLAIAGVIYRPGLLFGLYLLIPVYKGALQGYSPVDITAALALLNALQIIPVVADRRPRDVARAGIVLWFALAILILAGVLYAPDQDLALGRATGYWALVLLPILPAALRVGSERRHVRDLLWTFFWVGVVTVALGLTQLSSTARLVVLGTNTIQVGRAALLVPIVGITFVVRERASLVRAIVIILVPAAIIVALASGSRGPLFVLVALGAAGALRALARPRTLNWKLVGGIAGLAIASLVVVSLAAPNLPLLSIERFAQLGDFIQGGLSGDAAGAAAETSSAERVRLFGLAFSLFAGQPILGVGTAGFEALSPQFLGPINGLAYPHNALLQFAAEFGLIGVAIFAGLVLLALIRRLPRGTHGGEVRVLFLFFLLNAMVSGDIFSDRTTWGLLMLLLLMEATRVAEGWGPVVAGTGSGVLGRAALRPTATSQASVLGSETSLRRTGLSRRKRPQAEA